MQVQKTVFISYRRTNGFHARAVYQALTARGYDAFIDYESIDAGAFDQIILRQIDARAHFLIILTPSALERCDDPNDWLRREIERAIDQQRNIVPLMFDRFEFRDVQQYLVGKLAVLPRYSGVEIPLTFFDEAMERLHTRFLNKPLEMILHPTPPEDRAEVAQRQAAANAAPKPTEEQLTAEQYFEQALALAENGDYADAVNNYGKAIGLNPQYAYAYNNRGNARSSQQDYAGAIWDYDEAIRLNPLYANAYNNRGNVRDDLGDYVGAIRDYDEAIRLNPKHAGAYSNRGAAHQKVGDHALAISDYDEAIRLDPQYAPAYNNRGEVNFSLKKCDQALSDFRQANELRPGHYLVLAGLAITHHAMGNVREARRLWRVLLGIDEKYRDADWVQKELDWAEPLVEEARKLIAGL